MNLHIKIKHNGGKKSEREKLAKQVLDAHLGGGGKITKDLEMKAKNLPPGLIEQAA